MNVMQMQKLSSLSQEQLSKIETGYQIAYVPGHPIDEFNIIEDSYIEYGFVTSKSCSGYFCRYWIKGKEGIKLRTTANSESTNLYDLFKYEKVDQDIINKFLKKILVNNVIKI